LLKGTFSQEITDSLGLQITAGTSASEKFNTELQLNWKIVNNVAVYVKGGYAQIDYNKMGITDKYGNIWTGGIGLEWTFGGASRSTVKRDESGTIAGSSLQLEPKSLVQAEDD